MLANTCLYETIQAIGLDLGEIEIELTRILQYPAEREIVIDMLAREIMDANIADWDEYPNTYGSYWEKLRRELQLLCADIEVLNRTVVDPTLKITGVRLISPYAFVLEFNLNEIYC